MRFADVTLMTVKVFFGYFLSLTNDLRVPKTPASIELYRLAGCVRWVWSCLFCSSLYTYQPSKRYEMLVLGA